MACVVVDGEVLERHAGAIGALNRGDVAVGEKQIGVLEIQRQVRSAVDQHVGIRVGLGEKVIGPRIRDHVRNPVRRRVSHPGLEQRARVERRLTRRHVGCGDPAAYQIMGEIECRCLSPGMEREEKKGSREGSEAHWRK